MTQIEYCHINDDTEMIINNTKDNKQRTCTDRSHLFEFLMFFVLWSGIAIYACSTGDTIFNYNFRRAFDEYMSALFDGRFVLLGFIWLAILCIGLFFIVINWIPKCTIYFTNFIILASMITALILNLVLLPVISIAIVPFYLVAFAIFGTILYVLNQVGTDLVCQIIRDSSRAIRAFPLSIVIAIVQLALIAFIIFCCATTSHYLATSLRYANGPALTILMTINILYSVWMVFFVLNVGRALLHGNFVVWHRAEDKSAIPKDVLARQFNNTFKYHLGTLAFGSTIFSKLQVLRSMLSSEVRLNTICQSPPKFLCFLIILGHTTVNSLIFSVMHGKHSFESTKDSLNLLIKNDKKFVAVRVVTRLIIAFGLAIIPIIPTGFAAAYFVSSDQHHSPSDVMTATMPLLAIICLVLTAIFLYVFDSAVEAVLFSYLHELNASENVAVSAQQVVANYYQHM